MTQVKKRKPNIDAPGSNQYTMVPFQEYGGNAMGTRPAYGIIPSGGDKVTSTYETTKPKPTQPPKQPAQAQQPQEQQPQGGGSTNDPYIAQANALYQQLMSRGPFRYDLQGDMLYRQYADQYQQMGRQAMQDTMGYAAGQTGGYNSSWGQSLGQQAYQGYLGQLNAMVPDFYDRAYQAYMNEGDRLLQQYELALQHPGYIAAMRGSGGGTKQEVSKEEAAQLSGEYLGAVTKWLGGTTSLNSGGLAKNLVKKVINNKFLERNPTAQAQAQPEQQVAEEPLDLNGLWYKYLKKVNK